ncbi:MULTISPECIES: hypothetical protein [unclassified Streptomyces]|uniref:hypothetical protein n=1 Tax=unclassified Streptomyces TaxID=2593676 RepID=UPI0033300E07|nr:hypothetical protein OG254_37240 [Streptomyces sp. NBC_01092]
MSSYNMRDYDGTAHDGSDPAAVLRLAERLVERLRIEKPALVPQGEIIVNELLYAAQDGLPANRGRIRFALEAIGIGVPAGGGCLILVQEIGRVLDV